MPNPNDMTHWPEIRCQRGHEFHATKTVGVNLSTPHRYLDHPQVPGHLAQVFEIEIWDYEPYMTEGPYCPARDVVSEVIESHGIWEPIETITMLDLFHRAPRNKFIDMGAQIGWYSVLARLAGLSVVAFEADFDVSEVLRRNLQVDEDAVVVNGRIGQDILGYIPFRDERHLTVKMDLEGAEPDGVRMLEGYLAQDLVDFMLIEISPVFHDGYAWIFDQLAKDKMWAYRLPSKSHPPPRYRSISDLHEMVPTEIMECLGGHQENVLFVRDGLL